MSNLNNMDFPSTQVLDDNDDSSSSRSSESLQKTPKRVYQVATLTVGNKKYPIFEGINKVGRHSDNDICINDHNVSMYHAEIEADAKHAFICDLRSTNKTRMNDEKLKSDRFYQLLDGAKLTFGILNGTYLRLRDDESIIVPSTPEPGLKLRKDSNKNSSRANTSSTADSDDSVVLGTQDVPEAVFAKPLVPHRSTNVKDTSNNAKITFNESDKSIHDEETQRTNTSTESQSLIHECVTQKCDSKQPDEKRVNKNKRQKSKRNIMSEESEIFDKETQKFVSNNNDIDDSQISTQRLENKQIHDAETQGISEDRQDDDLDNAMTQRFENKKIYDVETQKQNEFESQDSSNVYNIATQRFQPLNIRKEKTEIYDVETQHLIEKSNKSKNQNLSKNVLNASSQKAEIIMKSDGEDKEDNLNDMENNMVLRSRNNHKKIMTTIKKVCINNSSSNNKFDNTSQQRPGLRINETDVETTQSLSTLISNESCLIVAETDDESETDDEGVFLNFLQKQNSNAILDVNNIDNDVINETNLNNEDFINNEVNSSDRNCASPVLVNLDEIPGSLRDQKGDNIANDSDNEMYMTPNQGMSPIKPNNYSNSTITINNLPKKKLSLDSRVNFYNDEDATQRVSSPTQEQENEKNKKNALEATQSMAVTQALVETQKIDLIDSETNLLETQIINTQVHKVDDFESPKNKRVLKRTTQLADTQVLEIQSLNELSECVDKGDEKINNSIELSRISKKTEKDHSNQLNYEVNNEIRRRKICDDNNDEKNNRNLNNYHDEEPTQLMELENDTIAENTLEEQEIQDVSEMNNDCDINEKPLKTLRLKKKRTSKNSLEWQISSSCRIDCNDDSFHQESQETSKNENNDESSDNDENEFLSPKKVDNKDQKHDFKTLVSVNKINLSLNRSTKNESKNKKENNHEIHTSDCEDNDVVLKSLDNMFGEVTNEDMVEPTQLLTQQLVDILKTPEKFDNLDTVVNNIDKFQKVGVQKNVKDAKKKKEETLGSSVDEESQELYFAHLNSKRKRKVIFDSQNSSDSERSSKYRKNSSDLKDEPCLSGFVNGVAIVCNKQNSQGSKETINHKKLNDENDDILSELPEFNFNGSGLSPGSQNSLDSSDEDIQSNEKKVVEKPQVASKMNKSQKSVLSILCDNKINDNDNVSGEQTKTVTVQLSHHDNKRKSSASRIKSLKSDEKIKMDREKINKTKKEKEQMNRSQASKPEPNSEVSTSGYNSSSESKEVKVYKKRTASCDPSHYLIEPKKKRPVVSLDNSLNISMRQEFKRKSFQVQKYYVIFTGISAEDYIESIKSLGGIVTDEPSKATILVTDKVRRTYKFICAISRSIPIVSIKWIDECIEKKVFLDPDEYILKDKASEIKFNFELNESLKKSSEGLLLQGYTFIITPKIVNPSIKDLKDMIHVAGGKSLIRMPRLWLPNTVIVGCDDDIPKIKEIIKKVPKNITVPVVTTEFILSGILKQKLEPEVYEIYL